MNQKLLRIQAVLNRIALLIGLVFTMWNPTIFGQIYEKVFDFAEARVADVVSKGAYPFANLVQGNDGNFYGTTQTYNSVFKMTPAGVLTTLVEFTGNGASNKGAEPYASLVKGGDGNFYGTTREGGANGLGTVFKMTGLTHLKSE